MFDKKDYTEMPLDALISLEKKMRSMRIPVSLLFGLFMGLGVFAATHKGGFVITVIVMIIGLTIGVRFSQNLTSIQTELNRRNTNQ